MGESMPDNEENKLDLSKLDYLDEYETAVGTLTSLLYKDTSPSPLTPIPNKAKNILERIFLKKLGDDHESFLATGGPMSVFKMGSLLLIYSGVKNNFSSRFFSINENAADKSKSLESLFFIQSNSRTLESDDVLPLEIADGARIFRQEKTDIEPEGNPALKELIIKLARGEQVDIKELETTYDSFVERFNSLPQAERPIFSGFGAPVTEFDSHKTASTTDQIDPEKAAKSLKELNQQRREEYDDKSERTDDITPGRS